MAFSIACWPANNSYLLGSTQFAHDLVLLARLVALACQEDGVIGGELGGVGTFQPAGHEIRVRHQLFADEAGAIDVGIGRGLDPLDRESSRS